MLLPQFHQPGLHMFCPQMSHRHSLLHAGAVRENVDEVVESTCVSALIGITDQNF